MKNAIILFLVCLSFVGCKSKTPVGECVGLFDDKDPTLVYKIDMWNTVWSMVGFEFIIPPLLWATHFAYCPVAKK